MGSKNSKPPSSNLRRNVSNTRSRNRSSSNRNNQYPSSSNNSNNYNNSMNYHGNPYVIQNRRRFSHDMLSEIYEEFDIPEEDLKRLSKRLAKSLKIYHVVKLEENDIELQLECPICLEELTTDDKVYLLPCCHFYHKKCLKEWFKNEPVCPNCRLELGSHTQEEVDMALFNRENKLKQGEEEKRRRLSSDDTNLEIKNDIIIDDSDVFLSDIEKKALIEYYNNKSKILNDLSNINDVTIDDDNCNKEDNSVKLFVNNSESEEDLEEKENNIIIDDSNIFLSDIEKKALIEYYNNKSNILNDLSNIDDVIIDDDNCKEDNSVKLFVNNSESEEDLEEKSLLLIEEKSISNKGNNIIIGEEDSLALSEESVSIEIK